MVGVTAFQALILIHVASAGDVTKSVTVGSGCSMSPQYDKRNLENSRLPPKRLEVAHIW